MAQSENGITERKVKDCFARGWDVYFAVMNAVASGDWPGRTTYGGRDQRPLWGKRAVKMDIGVVVELPSPPPRSCSQSFLLLFPLQSSPPGQSRPLLLRKTCLPVG